MTAQHRDPARPTARLRPDEAGIAAAADLLARGGLVAFPTETVYGLGADGRDARAVASLYAAKGRPSFNPLIAHVATLEAARREGVFDALTERLVAAFWPGPLTVVVPVAPTCSVCDLARAGLGTIALRLPAHPLARALIAATSRPIVAPSANLSGRMSPSEAAHVLADLDGRIDALIEGEACAVGLESTVVASLGGAIRLLRPGGVSRAAIEAVLGCAIGPDDPSTDPTGPIAPGALLSHYAPRAGVRLAAGAILPGEAALLFGPTPPAGLAAACGWLNLSLTGDMREAAANLFGHLHRLDALGADTIAVAPIPPHGLGEAIADRLRRAAAAR